MAEVTVRETAAATQFLLFLCQFLTEGESSAARFSKVKGVLKTNKQTIKVCPERNHGFGFL